MVYILIFIATVLNLTAAGKVAVLPFINATGQMSDQEFSYGLQDSLFQILLASTLDSNSTLELISIDDVEDALAQMNIDPSGPQYKSDMWLAAKKLGAKKVITGIINYSDNRYLINAYIYSVKMKMANPKYQAKNIFKSKEQIYESIEIISEKLLPGLK